MGEPCFQIVCQHEVLPWFNPNKAHFQAFPPDFSGLCCLFSSFFVQSASTGTRDGFKAKEHIECIHINTAHLTNQ